MSFYRILAEIFGRKPNSPTFFGTITKEELLILFNLKYCYILDTKYKLTSKEKVEEFLLNDNVSFQKFRKEKNDCENFAVQLNGRLNEWAPEFALGFAISKNHAFNVFIDSDKKVWIIEPQTDKIMSIEEAKKIKGDITYYPFRMVLI